MTQKPDILVRFGRKVRTLRTAKGFSQEAFAAHCGLDRTYVGGIERGERNIALRTIAVIARALDMTISQLLQGVESESNND